MHRDRMLSLDDEREQAPPALLAPDRRLFLCCHEQGHQYHVGRQRFYAYTETPRLKHRGFLLSFHLFTLVGKGTLMETNKTFEPTTSGVEDIHASGPNQSVFRWLLLLLPTHAHLRTLPHEWSEAREENIFC